MKHTPTMSTSSVEHSTKTNGIKRKYDASSSKASSSKSLPYDKNSISRNTQSQVKTFRKTYKEISPDAQMIVDQIIDPESPMQCTRVPAYGVSSVYTSHNIIQAAYDANGVSCVTVYPCLQDAIFATAGNLFTQQLTAAGGTSNPYVSQPICIRGDATAITQVVQPFYFTNKHVALPKPSTVAQAMLYPIQHAGLPATSPILANFQLSNIHSAANLEAVVSFWSATETFATSVNVVFDATGSASIQLWSNVAQINARWLSFDIRQAAGGSVIPFEGSCVVQLVDATGLDPGVSLTNVSQHCIAYNLNGYSDIIRSAESFFIAAQSCLLTYEGSDLNSGGRIAIARVPQNSVIGQPGGNSGTPSFDSWYDWLSSLSRNSYNGRVKTGGYAFYLGQDDRSYFYRPVEQVYPDDLPYIAAEWSSEVAAPQAVRIMVTTVCQYTTNSNVFDQAPSPYLGEDWCKILHILSCINAAYDNPGHRKKLTDALKKVGGKVLGLLKDPNTYMTMGKIAAMLAAV